MTQYVSFLMKTKEIFKIPRSVIFEKLRKYYGVSMCNMILRGERPPKYYMMVEMARDHDIPFDVWLDIKSHLTNDTKDENESSSAKPTKNTPKKEEDIAC